MYRRPQNLASFRKCAYREPIVTSSCNVASSSDVGLKETGNPRRFRSYNRLVVGDPETPYNSNVLAAHKDIRQLLTPACPV